VTSDRSRARRIRVLVAEDSRFVCGLLHNILASDRDLEVVGFAGDGVEAVAAVARLAPDVVTLDVQMPRADGLQALEAIMAEHPTPVLMVSAHTRAGSAATIRALELGAVDFVPKQSGIDLGLDELRDEIIRKIKMAARVKPIRSVAGLHPGRRWPTGTVPAATAIGPDPEGGRPDDVRYVVIAASTGGPAALLQVVPQLPWPFPAAVVIAQHMPAPFTAQFARELAARSAMVVKEAEAGDRVTRGTAYVAPGFHHLTLDAHGRVRLQSAERHDGECPSANLAMTSVAELAGSSVVGVVLTGMGRDGAAGVRAIKRAGGTVIAQDESSALVNGMPRAAIETGCVDIVLPLERLAAKLCAIVGDGIVSRRRVGHAS
jgi:two-component system, chemotaxis family, protein-glutamate methylesterase/glutaminase